MFIFTVTNLQFFSYTKTHQRTIFLLGAIRKNEHFAIVNVNEYSKTIAK